MITKKQEQILDNLFKPKKPSNNWYSEEDYDKMGIYGHSYNQLEDDDYEEEYEDDEEDEEVPY